VDLIDDHLFIEALALSAFEVVYRDPQPSNVQKVSQLEFNILCLDYIARRENESLRMAKKDLNE
jgi:hypothetical protein